MVNGNTMTTFKAADTRDIDMAKLKTWNDFAAQHPKVAKELASQPALINDMVHAKSHPDLDSFFSAHLDIHEAMAENPGTYVAIPSRPGE